MSSLTINKQTAHQISTSGAATVNSQSSVSKVFTSTSFLYNALTCIPRSFCLVIGSIRSCITQIFLNIFSILGVKSASNLKSSFSAPSTEPTLQQSCPPITAALHSETDAAQAKAPAAQTLAITAPADALVASSSSTGADSIAHLLLSRRRPDAPAAPTLAITAPSDALAAPRFSTVADPFADLLLSQRRPETQAAPTPALKAPGPTSLASTASLTPTFQTTSISTSSIEALLRSKTRYPRALAAPRFSTVADPFADLLLSQRRPDAPAAPTLAITAPSDALAAPRFSTVADPFADLLLSQRRPETQEATVVPTPVKKAPSRALYNEDISSSCADLNYFLVWKKLKEIGEMPVDKEAVQDIIVMIKKLRSGRYHIEFPELSKLTKTLAEKHSLAGDEYAL